MTCARIWLRQQAQKKNKAQVNTIKDRLANSREKFKSNPISDARKIKNRNNMLNIVELILEFNLLNQAGKRLTNTNTKSNA